MMLATVLFAATMLHSPKTPTANAVVRDALKVARENHKNVAVYFHASWCPWCKRFEKLWASPCFASNFSARYVLAKIDVRERDELRLNENSGWEPLMLKLRGSAEHDVPYLAILSPDGDKIVDSYRSPTGHIPGNAGYPKTQVEIEAFLALIEKTGTGFNSKDLQDLKDLLLVGPNI